MSRNIIMRKGIVISLFVFVSVSYIRWMTEEEEEVHGGEGRKIRKYS